MSALLATLVVAAGLGLAIRLRMDRPAEDRLAAGERVALAALRAPLPQNTFLACPPGTCAGLAQRASPVFAMPPARLRECWQRMIEGEHRVVQVEADPAQDRVVYVQHTPLLRFPDIVTVEFVALADAGASVAIYSRARYGKWDFGTNRKRVERWLARLVEIAASGGRDQPHGPGGRGRPAGGTEPR